MALTAGIVGLPNVGKSTLFNAITKAGALAANYPFATIDPNVGVVRVPDARLDELIQIYVPDSKVPTLFEFTDIAGLVKGASKGEGKGNQFLSHIRETDAIAQVVRCFDNDDIIHVDGSVDPIRDIETINLELIFADLEVIEKRLPKIEKMASMKRDNAHIEKEILVKIHATLMEQKRAIETTLTADEFETIKHFNFLTIKPMLYICNVGEDEISDYTNNKYVKLVQEYALKDNSKCVVISAQIEAELSELDDESKKMFLSDLGIKESGLDILIKEAYDVLGLATYFTAGKKEVRAWTFKKGMSARECAGIIHTDFYRGFIRAEVVSYEDIFTLRDEKKAKEAGKYRSEGKDYLMKDGDICLFRFNV